MFIAIFALVISFFALVWNIVRDMVMDREELKIRVDFGGVRRIRGTEKGIFIPKNNGFKELVQEETFLFSIVNSGKKTIGIEAIGIRYKKSSEEKMGAKCRHIVCSRLPKMLKPYETFNEFNIKIEKIQEIVKNKDIDYFWVRDTKNKYWRTSRKNLDEIFSKIK